MCRSQGVLGNQVNSGVAPVIGRKVKMLPGCNRKRLVLPLSLTIFVVSDCFAHEMLRASVVIAKDRLVNAGVVYQPALGVALNVDLLEVAIGDEISTALRIRRMVETSVPNKIGSVKVERTVCGNVDSK